MRKEAAALKQRFLYIMEEEVKQYGKPFVT
jgi:hypothetical protein